MSLSLRLLQRKLTLVRTFADSDDQQLPPLRFRHHLRDRVDQLGRPLVCSVSYMARLGAEEAAAD
jgi:hypothetical protein